LSANSFISLTSRPPSTRKLSLKYSTNVHGGFYTNPHTSMTRKDENEIVWPLYRRLHMIINFLCNMINQRIWHSKYYMVRSVQQKKETIIIHLFHTIFFSSRLLEIQYTCTSIEIRRMKPVQKKWCLSVHIFPNFLLIGIRQHDWRYRSKTIWYNQFRFIWREYLFYANNCCVLTAIYGRAERRETRRSVPT